MPAGPQVSGAKSSLQTLGSCYLAIWGSSKLDSIMAKLKSFLIRHGWLSLPKEPVWDPWGLVVSTLPHTSYPPLPQEGKKEQPRQPGSLRASAQNTSSTGTRGAGSQWQHNASGGVWALPLPCPQLFPTRKGAEQDWLVEDIGPVPRE